MYLSVSRKKISCSLKSLKISKKYVTEQLYDFGVRKALLKEMKNQNVIEELISNSEGVASFHSS